MTGRAALVADEKVVDTDAAETDAVGMLGAATGTTASPPRGFSQSGMRIGMLLGSYECVDLASASGRKF